MRNSFQFYSVLLFLLLFWACDNEPESAAPMAMGDVYIQSRLVNDELVYAPVFYAYANSAMKTVSVKHEDQESVSINLYEVNGPYTFAHVPDSANQTSEYPKSGLYDFSISYEDGKELVVYDYLDSVALEPVTIKEIVYESEDNKLIIDWEKLELADAYKVWLIDANDTIAYSTNLISKETSKTAISRNSNGWYTEMQPSLSDQTVYTLVIEAFLFEPYGSVIDIQSISTFKQTGVVWGM